MKTVVIVHHTGEWGGGTKSLLDLCEMLHDDYRIIVCIPKGYPEFSKKIANYDCECYELNTPIPFVNIYSGRPPLLSVVSLRSILSLKHIKLFGNEILKLKPDVVIFNTLITAISGRYLSSFTKVICIDRETLTSSLSKKIYRTILDGKLNAITFLSQYEEKKLHFRHTLTAVLPDCVKLYSLKDCTILECKKRENVSDDKFVILFMGGLAKIKGTDVMLKAMELLDDKYQLIFAGEMKESKLSKKQLIHDIKYLDLYFFKKRVKKSYNQLKGTSKLIETGLKDSIDELIIASDIIVFPSTSVHQPRPCIEAGAYGKPVIISDYKETEEYFIDGYNAMTFKPGSARELADKIRYANGHLEELEIMGRNNRLMTERLHDFKKCKEVICSLIEKVCKDAN